MTAATCDTVTLHLWREQEADEERRASDLGPELARQLVDGRDHVVFQPPGLPLPLTVQPVLWAEGVAVVWLTPVTFTRADDTLTVQGPFDVAETADPICPSLGRPLTDDEVCDIAVTSGLIENTPEARAAYLAGGCE